jgi:hypothetical protein
MIVVSIFLSPLSSGANIARERLLVVTQLSKRSQFIAIKGACFETIAEGDVVLRLKTGGDGSVILQRNAGGIKQKAPRRPVTQNDGRAGLQPRTYKEASLHKFVSGSVNRKKVLRFGRTGFDLLSE